MRVMGESMVFMIIYVWSRRNPDTPMSFFGACPRVHARRRARYRLPLTLWVYLCVCVVMAGFRFTGIYMPWVLVAFHVLIARSPVTDLIGIAAGHVYYFLQEVLPAAETPFRGKRFLHTPSFLCVPRCACLCGSVFAVAAYLTMLCGLPG